MSVFTFIEIKFREHFSAACESDFLPSSTGRNIVAHTHQLVGPTGETNELYIYGRGVALIIQDDDSVLLQKAVIAQLTAALVAGNSAVYCSDDAELFSALKSAFGAVNSTC